MSRTFYPWHALCTFTLSPTSLAKILYWMFFFSLKVDFAFQVWGRSGLHLFLPCSWWHSYMHFGAWAFTFQCLHLIKVWLCFNTRYIMKYLLFSFHFLKNIERDSGLTCKSIQLFEIWIGLVYTCLYLLTFSIVFGRD